MPQYQVAVTRTSARRVWIDVEAVSEDEAKQKAMDQVGDQNFFEGTESTPEYAVEEVHEQDAEPAKCARCSSPVDANGFCTDPTCAFNDHLQTCPVGMTNQLDPSKPSEDAVCNCGGKITADVHSDDHVYDIIFNATLWFKQATAEEIQALADCDWHGDYPADVVAEFFDSVDHPVPDIIQMFKYLAGIRDTKGECGFECHVHKDLAMDWLKINRPSVAETLAKQGNHHAANAN